MKKYIKPTVVTKLVAITAILTASNVVDYKGEYDGTQILKSKDDVLEFDEE